MKQKRLNFSQRMSIKPILPEFKPGELSSSVRIKFWNHLTAMLELLQRNDFEQITGDTIFLRDIWTNYFKQRRDQFNKNNVKKILENLILNSSHSPNELLDLIEYIIFESTLNEKIKSITESEIELILVNENAAFRFYKNGFMPIASELEANALQDALKLPESAVTKHLVAASEFLKKNDESYIRNSIKESISAVLATFYLICNERKDSVSDYLKLCEKKKLKIQLHKCFQIGFAKFYNWTSGEQGIRHEILEGETTPSYAEAQFMLHICSAAVNMLLRNNQSSTETKSK
jgi:hypothetical protein